MPGQILQGLQNENSDRIGYHIVKNNSDKYKQLFISLCGALNILNLFKCKIKFKIFAMQNIGVRYYSP